MRFSVDRKRLPLLRQLHRPLVHFGCYSETFARCFFKTLAIEDRQFPAVVFDEIGLLKEARGEVHALSADAEHVAEEFLREMELVLAVAVSSLQEPAAHAFLDRVVLNAGAV